MVSISELKFLKVAELREILNGYPNIEKMKKPELLNTIDKILNKHVSFPSSKKSLESKPRDEYKKISTLGNKGKDGIVYLVKKGDKHFAMKVFKDNKSQTSIEREGNFLRSAGLAGFSPKLVCIDKGHIIMEKMDKTLFDILKSSKGKMSLDIQKRILEIFRGLDNLGIFHSDPSLLNFMICKGKLFIIDFGMSKKITDGLKKKHNSDNLNCKFMTLGFLLKLKEIGLNPLNYNLLYSSLSERDKKIVNL